MEWDTKTTKIYQLTLFSYFDYI